MKHIFILNPAAGKGKASKVILPEILRTVRKKNLDYEIHRTVNCGDGENFTRMRCEQYQGGTQSGSISKQLLRFYAVGGDGTLSEVVNGISGFADVEAACIPAGTGNDFVRNFGSLKNFRNIEKQVSGASKPIDLIKYGDRLAVNTCNAGLDCSVVEETQRMKEYPFMEGPQAYLMGAVKALGGSVEVDITAEMEDGVVITGPFLLAVIANGGFYGGGFHVGGRARLDDGLFDLCLVNPISRMEMLRVAPKFRNGTFLDWQRCQNYVYYSQCRKVTFRSSRGTSIAVDGEITTLYEETFSAVPSALKFVVPAP